MISSFTGQHRFLSNFWPSDVMFEGLNFPTVEHAYQAAKTTDKRKQEALQSLETPGQAKRFGKRLKLRAGWNSMKLGVMEDLVRQKFQHQHLKDLLLATGRDDLVEGNTWGDTFWGVCNGEGENNLGKILMKIRGEICGDV